MRNRLLIRRVITSFTVFLLISSISQISADIYWDFHLDSFTYFRNEVTTTFDPVWEETEVEYVNDTLTFSILESTGNTVSFKVSDNTTIVDFYNCETPQSEAAILDYFGHDNVSGSINLDLIYDTSDGKFGFLVPYYHYNTYVGFYCEIPIHILDFIFTFNVWNGIFGCFLPLSLEDFSFDTYVDIVETKYDEFEYEEKSTFTYNDTKLKGFAYEVYYSLQEQESSLIKNITNSIIFQYLPNGVLCKYESLTKIQDIFEEEVILFTDILSGIYLETGYSTFKATVSTQIIALTLVVLVLFSYRKKKNYSSNH